MHIILKLSAILYVLMVFLLSGFSEAQISLTDYQVNSSSFEMIDCQGLLYKNDHGTLVFETIHGEMFPIHLNILKDLKNLALPTLLKISGISHNDSSFGETPFLQILEYKISAEDPC